MKKAKRINYRWLSIGFVVISIFCSNVKSESGQEKDNLVCKRKILWKARVCPANKLICHKNKKYVEKAKHYIKALGSDNPTRRIKASYKLMRIAPYILSYLKKEYKKAKNAEQSNALLVYKTINLLKDVELKIMCKDGKGGFMWYAVISATGMGAPTPTGYMGLGFILVGNEKGVIGGIQVRTGTDQWKVSNYFCDLRDGSRTKFAIEISGGWDSFIVTENWYYRNAKLYTTSSKNFYGIVEKKPNGQYVALVDNKESEEYNRIGKVIFSSDGSRYGFIAKKSNGKYVAVIDGKESKEYDRITGKTGMEEEIVLFKIQVGIGMVEKKESEGITFSPSGHRYGFVAEKSKDKYI